MDTSKAQISQENTFEKIKTKLSIYDSTEFNPNPDVSNSSQCCRMNIQNILEGISLEALMLQAADRNIAKDRRKVKSQLITNRNFTQLKKLKDSGHIINTTKFETQMGVSDTQLIAFADGAEAVMQMVANKETTQLFNVSAEKKTIQQNIHEARKMIQNEPPSASHKSKEKYSDSNKDSNSNATETDSLNEYGDCNQIDNLFDYTSKNIPENSNTNSDNSQDKILTSSPILEQKTNHNQIVHIDNDHNDKSINDNHNDLYNIFDDKTNLPPSPILNKKITDDIIDNELNNQIDNANNNSTDNLDNLFNDNLENDITSSPILNQKTSTSSRSPSISCKDKTNNITPPFDMQNQKHPSPVLNIHGFDSGIIHDRTKKNITSPILERKSVHNIQMSEDYNQIVENAPKNYKTSRNILKRKSNHGIIIDNVDDNNCDDKSVTKCSKSDLNNLKTLSSTNETVSNVRTQHKIAASQGLPKINFDKSRSPSPVLNAQNSNYIKRKKMTNKIEENRMVLELRSFSLHDFEKFEAISRRDLESCMTPIPGNKFTLNSQIINNEMSISQITDEEYEIDSISDVKKRKIDVSFQEELKDSSFEQNVLTGGSDRKLSQSGQYIADKKNLIDKESLEEKEAMSMSEYNTNTNQIQCSSTENNNTLLKSNEAFPGRNALLDKACMDEIMLEMRMSPNNSASELDTTVINKFQPLREMRGDEKISKSKDAVAKRMILLEKCLEGNILEIRNSDYSVLKTDININDFGGSSTGVNEQISMSEDAIAKRRMLPNGKSSQKDIFGIQKIPDISTSKSGTSTHTFLGFTTTNDRGMMMSKDTIVESNMLLDEACLEDDTSKIAEPLNDFSLKPLTMKFQGFRTANNKEISVSEDAIAKSKNVLDKACSEKSKASFGIDESQDISTLKSEISTNKFEGLSTASDEKVLISKDAIENSKMLLDGACLEEDTSAMEENFTDFSLKPLTMKFQGFRTALNKKISVSEDAIAKSKNVLDKACSEKSKASFGIDESQDNSTLKSEISTNEFEGFSTASEANVLISKDAITNSQMLLGGACLEEDTSAMEENFTDFSLKPLTMKFQGFRTALNKKISVSEDAIAKSKNVLDKACSEKSKASFGIDESQDNSTLKSEISTNEFEGFSTASEANVLISKDAITNSQMLLGGACLEEDTSAMEENFTDFSLKPLTMKFQGFRTALNKKISVSEDAIAKSKNVLDKACSEKSKASFGIDESQDISTLKSEISTNEFEGFSTASEANVLISKDAITNSQMLLGGACLEEDTSAIEENFTDFSLKPLTMKFQGFRTALNKKISVSEDAIAKSKNVLDKACSEKSKASFGIDESQDNSTLKSEISTNEFEGFSTASEANVLISKDAITNSQMLLGGACLEEDTSAMGENFTDFSLKPLTMKFQGFRTALNKKISVSEDAIAKSKNVLDKACSEKSKASFGIDESQDNSTLKSEISTNEFEGFSTASEANVLISKDAITNSQMLLGGACLEEDTSAMEENFTDFSLKPLTMKFQGFRTALNKKISISEDAIAKSKTVLDKACLEKGIFGIDESHDISTLKSEISTNKFEGFSTASDKKVVISKDAIAKSKMLIDKACLEEESINDTNNSKLKSDTKIDKFVCFSTANNKSVTISSTAIAETRKLFESLDESNISTLKPIKHMDKIDIRELIDTQVIDDFEKSVFTQEFEHKENEAIEVRKTAGSPILSCPKAKKYKNSKKTFKIPYSQSKTQKKIIIDNKNSEVIQNIPRITTPKIEFTNLNYIKSNRSTDKILLKDLNPSKDELSIPEVISGNSNNSNILDDLLNFEFNDKHHELPDVATFKDLKAVFEISVNESLIPNGWIENHFKLILWKLISYERLFGDSFDRILTVRNVFDQLKYRYDRELYQVQRPALRKILECDEPPSRTMVLCVAKICKIEDSKSTKNNHELDLTDSWYIVRSNLDAMLNSAVENGKIKIGTKLLIYGAELQNCEQGKSPLEDISAVRLKICGNSTRRVPWDTKLGFFRRPGPFRVNLDTIRPTGGKVAKMRVFVARIYPPVYIEKLEDGSTITRSERLETIYASKFESERQSRLEKIYAQIEKEFSDTRLDSQDDSPDACTDEETCSGRDVGSGSQLFKCMKRSRDPFDFQAHLTSTQTNRLRDFNSKKREKIMSRIQERVQQRIIESGVDKLNRNVVQLLKVRIVDWSTDKQRNNIGGDSTRKENCVGKSEMINGVISIWKPSEGLLEVIKEGIWLDVINSTPTAIRMSEIHISAGRQTIFNRCKNNYVGGSHQQRALRNVKSIGNIVENVRSEMLFNEIDTVGLVMRIEPDKFDSKSNFQNVFLTDRSKSVCCLNFWGGIEKFGYASLIKIGAFISCSSLQKRMGSSKRGIPHFRVTELSCFSLFPRNVIFSEALEKIKRDFDGINVDEFCRDFQLEKVQKSAPLARRCPISSDLEMSKNAMSPFGFQNKTEYDLEKNKQFLETPQIREAKRLQVEQNLLDTNLDGLDFESTFSANTCPTDAKLSPVKVINVKVTDVKVTAVKVTDVISNILGVEVLPRLKEQKIRSEAKLKRLKMYGEAPNLSPIAISNRSEVAKSYVSPLTVRNDSSTAGVAGVNNNTVQNRLECVASTSKGNLISESPKTNMGVKRRYLNPVKLKFQTENLDDCDLLREGDFAEDFEYSPPLSLD